MNLNTIKSPAGLVGFAAVAAFALLPFWSGSLTPDTYAGGRSRDVEARAVRNTSSAAVMLGEMRTAMSDIMFIKSERYLHSGVACKPHLQREILSASGAMAHVDQQRKEAGCGHDHAHDHGHDNAECGASHGEGHESEDLGCEVLIPDAGDDFRGLVGYLERQVKPYFGPDAPHAHTDGQELLPWFRVMTVSDPHYLPGYTTGAWWLTDLNPQEALDFIEEGVRNNPDSFQVRFVKGQVLLQLARQTSPDIFDPDPATRAILDQARATFAGAGELAMTQWLRENAAETWTAYQTEDAMASARMHVLMENKFGDPQEASRLAKRYLAVVGEDAALQRLADFHEATRG